MKLFLNNLFYLIAYHPILLEFGMFWNHRCCSGKGCKRSCHLFCLDPLLKDAPLGLWHCPFCMEKRMKSGVHSVSEGVEFILDFQEGKDPFAIIELS